ncbi:MAG: penicillin acylase family protein, partial [Caulobacter sp.]
YVQNSNDSYRWTHPASPWKLGPMMGTDPGPDLDPRTRSGVQEIQKVLASSKFDPSLGAATMLGDKSYAAQFVLAPMMELCDRPTAPTEACAALKRWDGQSQITSRGAMLFNLFWSRAGKRPEIWQARPQGSDPFAAPTLITQGVAGDGLLADLAAAAQAMKAQGLALDAPLGQVQFAERNAERIPISGAGAGGVLNYMRGRPVKGGFDVIHGTSYVQAVTFDQEGPVAQTILSYSQSTDPKSPHYADQTRRFSDKALWPFPFSEAQIQADKIGEALTVGPQ